MITDASLKKYTVDENSILVGKIEANVDLLQAEDFVEPFNRKPMAVEITKFGNRDYKALDDYIVHSLNDYYNRMMAATESEKKNMLKVYCHLYDMWQDLHNCKVTKNFDELDKVYDLFSYELYVLGYIG